MLFHAALLASGSESSDPGTSLGSGDETTISLPLLQCWNTFGARPRYGGTARIFPSLQNAGNEVSGPITKPALSQAPCLAAGNPLELFKHAHDIWPLKSARRP